MLICNVTNIKWSWKLEQVGCNNEVVTRHYNKKVGLIYSFPPFSIKPQQIPNSPSSKAAEVVKKKKHSQL